MGQYWYPVNLDKKEYINPHKLGAGLKLWEQLANAPGTQGALIILLAAMPEMRGGGDFDLKENWHGPERTFPEDSCSPGPMPASYPEIAKRTIGRWAGDRVTLVGDYGKKGDIASAPDVDPEEIYFNCCYDVDDGEEMPADPWTDISDDVCAVLEHELNGKFTDGQGWKRFDRQV